MITFPNCKINIGLQILNRRDDGYHNISTLMYPVDWCDILEITPSKTGKLILNVTGNSVDCPPEKNLVIKAYNAVKQYFNNIPAVEINLHKIIPDGAGLGGGSADASFTFKMLNEMFSIDMDNEKMAQIAKTIGADCPFFIYNTPSFATGIGDIFAPADIDLSQYKILIVKPESAVSTKEAYSGVIQNNDVPELKSLLSHHISEWKDSVVNDFEKSLFPNHPEIENVKNMLFDLGAVYASMTGSGAAVFGIFEDEATAKKASQLFKNLKTHIMHSSSI